MVQGSPGKNDIVVPVAYDEFGRQMDDYLPYVLKDTDTSDGSFKPNALEGANGYVTSEQYLFYQNTGEIADDPSPFARKKFEPSPLNRVTEQGAPGIPWQPHPTNKSGKTIKFRYLTNIGGKVRLWDINPGTLLPSSNAHYGVRQLFLNETEDEHGAETHEFVDKLGRIVLKEVENLDENGNVEWLQTYYVYDDFDNLRFVFPPKATALLGSSFTPSSFEDPILKHLVFQYRYDERQRMIMKKVPGAEPVYMVYDQFDRLVFTQDGNQFGATAWSFTKYDHLNRPVMTGTMPLANTWGTDRMAYRNGIQAQVNTYYTTHLATNPNYRYESFSATATWGYTDRSYPQLATGSHEVLTVTYYDNYDFLTDAVLGSPAASYEFVTELDMLNADVFARVKGLVTGSRTKVLEEDKYLNTVSYYDDRYRVIQTVTDNYTGGFDRVTTEYDFAGRVLRTRQTHRRGTNSFEDLVVNQSFTYDHASRLLNTYHRINNQDSVLLTANRYNEIGELVEKNLHSPQMTNPQFKQSVDYRYNIRGWLTRINNSGLTTGGINTGDQVPDYFGMELYYNEEVPGLNYDMMGNWQDPLNRPFRYFEQLLQGMPVKPIISYRQPDIFKPIVAPFKDLLPLNIQNRHKTGWGYKSGVDYRNVTPQNIKSEMGEGKNPGMGYYRSRHSPEKASGALRPENGSRQIAIPASLALGEGAGKSSLICFREEDVAANDDDEPVRWLKHITPEVFLDVDPATLTASLDGTIWVTGDFTTPVVSKERSVEKGDGTKISVLNQELWLEAECGTRGANWTMANDALASNSSYMVMQSGTSQLTTPPAAAADHLSFSFDITAAGDYKVWARTFTNTENDDSFWVRMDGGSWIKWNDVPAGSWLWDDVHDSDNAGAAVTFNLTAGSHTLDIAFRELGAKIDKLYISSSGGPPTGIGTAATNCVATAPPDDPTGLVSVRTSFNYVTFRWAANAQIVDDYNVERSVDNVNFTAIGTVGGSALSFQDNAIQAGTTYYYRIRANNSLGSSGFSASLNVSSVADPGIIKGPVTPLPGCAQPYQLSWVRYNLV